MLHLASLRLANAIQLLSQVSRLQKPHTRVLDTGVLSSNRTLQQISTPHRSWFEVAFLIRTTFFMRQLELTLMACNWEDGALGYPYIRSRKYRSIKIGL